MAETNEKPETRKTVCPLNEILACADCRWYKNGRLGEMCQVEYISHYLQGIAHE